MGDIADMMTNGDLCEGCGGYFDPQDKVYTAGADEFRLYHEVCDWGIPVYHINCGPKADEDLPDGTRNSTT